MLRIRLKTNSFGAVQYDGTQETIEIDGINHIAVSADTMVQVDVGDWIIFLDGEPHAVITDEAFKEYYEPEGTPARTEAQEE